ncbi:MAG: DUF4280 domain-containing protein [Alteromonadaceae bacterium]|nr:DUF4280 domain-containing protein [Alteromonadaceae bacterium]
MSQAVTMGATLECTCGISPSVLIVTPEKCVLQTTPVANIMDFAPFVNIVPFGLCNSPANPAVAAATAAAMGVLTPMPCIPTTVTPWITGDPTILLGNMPILTSDCSLMCMFGGCISVVEAGQIPVQLKE